MPSSVDQMQTFEKPQLPIRRIGILRFPNQLLEISLFWKMRAMKVLVVDDCLSIRTILKRYLKEWGFEVALAASGKAALNGLERKAMPRIIIVDWVMPEMQGPEMIREFRKQDPHRNSYIIMLTSKTGREALETAFRWGADDYLAKPIVKEELHRRICEGQNILERQDQVQSSVDKLTRAKVERVPQN
jgi:DNA-binding response OmpR family regulator